MATKGLRICIVEDDEDLRGIYALKFRNQGFEVIEAEDGEVGLKVIGEQNPDLILLDVMLPKVNGFEVLRRIKQDDKLKAIPVFILSNLGQDQEVKQGLDLKADKYFIKVHYTPEEIVEKVREFMKDKKSSTYFYG